MARPPISAKSNGLFRKQLDAVLTYVEGLGGGVAGPAAWAAITGKPSTFPPEAHTQAISTVTGLQTALDGKQASLVSATSIKTINGVSVLGSGDLTVSGGATKGTATVTASNNRMELSETVAATGVTGSSVVLLSIAPHADSDENDAEMLDILSMSAAPGTDQITVKMAFAAPTAGAIKLNWMAA